MNVLYLPIEAKWLNMIQADIKKEDYRRITPYWFKRLENKRFDVVCFILNYRYKYFYECQGIERKEGKVEWGAPPFCTVYAIKVGKYLGTDYKIPNPQLSLELDS